MSAVELILPPWPPAPAPVSRTPQPLRFRMRMPSFEICFGVASPLGNAPLRAPVRTRWKRLTILLATS